MAENLFESKQAFLDLFEISKAPDYYDPVFLQDTPYGFSVKRKYSDNIRYKPSVKNNGQPNNIAVLWITLDEREKTKDEEILLTVRISNYSLWQAHYFDNKEPESPTEVSIKASNKTPKPASLAYIDNFYYDPNNKVFLDNQRKTITGKQILDQAFQEHCDTVHPIKGLEYKIKLLTLEKFIAALNAFCWFLKFIIEKMFQRELVPKEEYLKDSLLNPFLNVRDTPEKQLSIFGHYKTHESTGMIFCVVAMLLSIAGYLETIRFEYARSLLRHDILLIIHSIPSLMLIEILPSKVIFPVLNATIKFKNKLMFIKLNPFSYKKWLPPVIYCIIASSSVYWIGNIILFCKYALSFFTYAKF